MIRTAETAGESLSTGVSAFPCDMFIDTQNESHHKTCTFMTRPLVTYFWYVSILKTCIFKFCISVRHDCSLIHLFLVFHTKNKIYSHLKNFVSYMWIYTGTRSRKKDTDHFFLRGPFYFFKKTVGQELLESSIGDF